MLNQRINQSEVNVETITTKKSKGTLKFLPAGR